jgi:hypothetical protein
VKSLPVLPRTVTVFSLIVAVACLANGAWHEAAGWAIAAAVWSVPQHWLKIGMKPPPEPAVSPEQRAAEIEHLSHVLTMYRHALTHAAPGTEPMRDSEIDRDFLIGVTAATDPPSSAHIVRDLASIMAMSPKEPVPA